MASDNSPNLSVIHKVSFTIFHLLLTFFPMLTPSMLPSARYRLEKCVSSLNVFPLKAWRIRLVESFLNPSACGETASAGAHVSMATRSASVLAFIANARRSSAHSSSLSRALRLCRIIPRRSPALHIPGGRKEVVSLPHPRATEARMTCRV